MIKNYILSKLTPLILIVCLAFMLGSVTTCQSNTATDTGQQQEQEETTTNRGTAISTDISVSDLVYRYGAGQQSGVQGISDNEYSFTTLTVGDNVNSAISSISYDNQNSNNGGYVTT